MQPDRKTKEDTWKSEELKKHLKAMQSEGSNNKRPKERRHRRDEDRDEHARRSHKSSDKTDEREHHKFSESDRHADRDRENAREHRREREKTTEADMDKQQISERHKIREREKNKERKYSGGNPTKEYGTSELSREERKLRDTLEKSKHRSDDRERRHQERRVKEGTKRENEDHKDRDLRHRKHREDLNSEDIQRERRRSDQNHSGNSDREKRHHSKREKDIPGDIELRSTADTVEYVDKVKETSRGQNRDKDQRHREKRENRGQTNERKKIDNQENSVYQRHSKDSLRKQESADEKEIEETIYKTDTAHEPTNYEEDFEDYDDDFEEDSEEDKTVNKHDPKAATRNAEIEEIQKAMLLENENIATIPAGHRHRSRDHHDHEPEPTEHSYTPRKGAHRGGVLIDFGSAKQRQDSSQVASKQKKRSLEILRLLDLDFSSTFSLLDLAPVKEYEMYIRNFGKTNTKQAYVQCNDDAVDREIQTEEIDIEEKWTQHPGEGSAVCGGHKNNAAEDMGLVTKVDSQRLATFLHSASQVITVLLEENRAENLFNCKVQPEEPCMSISDGCFSLNTNLPFLQGREVYQLQFSEAQRHLLLTVHGLCIHSDSAALSETFIICVWNIWQPSTPQKILICQSEVKCCCFSPGKASLVFAGTVDGSVVVWDLREDYTMHQTMKIEDANWTFRSATFSTDGVFTQVSHALPVKAIEPVPSTEAKDHGISSLASNEELSGLSFQVASLDESGHLIFWVVVELRKVDLAGSQSDLGLIPGGKVKLVHSSSINLSDKFYHKDVLTLGIPQTFNIKFLPRDSNHFVIGTDIGIVSHGTRYGLIEPPMQYTSLHSKLRPSQVTAIDFSPFGEPAFLAGSSDGCLRLHIISAEYPAMQWNDSTNGQSIIALQWSLTRPTVFFVLDTASSIYIWDLLQNDLQPVARESIMPDQVLSMSVFGEPEKNNNLMGLALAKSSGKVEIQYIKKKFVKIQPKELEKLHLILHEIL
ncbi:cytoplasmic dynein 2 intermediate chain 1 [Mixophyes fleayi]|uniref:cytoplasmic dynein 2 intermediate chain 1 n=1 Tax=Mixophyes fleayi TaxID=3061075 RepID=UPI003F4E4412